MSRFLTKKSRGQFSDEGPSLLPPFLYPSRIQSEQAWMAKLKKGGKVRSIGPRLLTSLPEQGIEKGVKSNWSDIVSHLYPNSILSHRSALEFCPTAEGNIFLTSTTNRIVRYPGLVLNFVRGPRPLTDDVPLFCFHASSGSRALLENLSTTKISHGRALPTEKLENWLENFLHTQGEEKLNHLRDRAREIAQEFQWDREFKKLDRMIGAILGTRPIKSLKGSVSQARAKGKPFDPHCNEKLELLFSHLRANPLQEIKETFKSQGHFNNKAFFEAYFSNYIEGTTFEIEEAEQIIFDKQIPDKRPKDAHDILGTYQIVSDPNLMQQCPTSPEELESILKNRHSLLMKERPEALPGEYKRKPNRAGDTHFVHPDYSEGTLLKGFEKYQALPIGMERAIFMMFLISEVHPFTDGNGRIARILMNAELYSQGLSTLIIPNVYREDYLLALRALTRRLRPDPLIKMLVIAQRFSALEFSPYKKVLTLLEEQNWFREPGEARLMENR